MSCQQRRVISEQLNFNVLSFNSPGSFRDIWTLMSRHSTAQVHLRTTELQCPVNSSWSSQDNWIMSCQQPRVVSGQLNINVLSFNSPGSSWDNWTLMSCQQPGSSQDNWTLMSCQQPRVISGQLNCKVLPTARGHLRATELYCPVNSPGSSQDNWTLMSCQQPTVISGQLQKRRSMAGNGQLA